MNKQNKDEKEIELGPNEIVIDLDPDDNKKDFSNKNKKIEIENENLIQMKKKKEKEMQSTIVVNYEDKNVLDSENQNYNNEVKRNISENLVNHKIEEDIKNNVPPENKPYDFINEKTFNNEFIFFFINPSSGSNEGQQVINMGVKRVEFIETYKSSAFIFNILDRTNFLEGISLLRMFQQQGNFYVFISS